jgi:hypothetical protein
MKRIITTLPALFMAALLAACSQNSAQEAKQVVTNFYQANQTTHPAGALSLSELLTFRQFVSVPLFELLKNVSEAEEAHMRETNDQEPPLVDGNLLTSLPEGATTYRIINCQLESDQGMCRVELVFSNAQHQSPAKWIDKVVLSKDVRGWVIANIIYAGENSNMRKGDLHGTLLHILSNTASRAEQPEMDEDNRPDEE